MNDENDSLDLTHLSTVSVFCRVRPIDAGDCAMNVTIKTPNCIALTSSTEQLRKETQFFFKHVFGPQSTQSEIYRVVAQPLVEKLVIGGNGLLFTYGVTGSGKTHTMMGQSDNFGIMPRCLDALFQTIAGYHAKKSIFQSDHLNGFEILTEAEALAKQKAERRAANLNQKSTTTTRSKSTEFLVHFNRQDSGPTHVSGIDERNVYAIFVSYIQIYNNKVYDLLEDCCTQKIPQSRMVREDSNHNMYVHGVTEIEIRSVTEGMEAFYLGQKRKKIGQTLLNAESSRSHAIFNIRLVQARIGQHERDNKRTITISQLSLVDLAGSERSSRTKNTGAQLREAGNINNSLMTLRTCFEYLRENQQAAPGSVRKKIPYRDSKITQLFKNFFEGEGQVSMVTCIHPRPEDFLENSQVLKFAEITQEIQVPCALTVQLTNSDNEIIQLLRAKFGGDADCSIGDGPLSQKLYNLFEHQLKIYEEAKVKMQTEVNQYRIKIRDLEEKNNDLKFALNKLQLSNQKACEENRMLEQIIKTQKLTIKGLQRNLANENETNMHSRALRRNASCTWPFFNVHNARSSQRPSELVLSVNHKIPLTLLSAINLYRSEVAKKAETAAPTLEVAQHSNFIGRLTNINTMNDDQNEEKLSK